MIRLTTDISFGFRMEEMFLRVCVLVISLLYIKDNSVFEGQDEDIIAAMQDREDLLQMETIKLEQEVHSLTTELSRSNKEVLQGEASEVQQTLPNDKKEKSTNHPNILHDHLFLKDKHNELQESTISVLPDDVSQRVPNADHKGSELVHDGQIDLKDIQAKEDKDMPAPTGDQKHYGSDSTSRIVKQAARVESASFIQNIYEFMQKTFQTSQEIHSSQGQKDLEGIDDSRMQVVSNTVLNSEEIQDAKQNSSQNSENTYTWYFWKILSLLSVIRLIRKCFSSNSKTSETVTFMKSKTVSASLATKISLPESKIMTRFYDQCVQIPPNMSGQVCEFVEGFVDELLEAARESSSEEVNMQIGDSIGVGSLYETWATGRKMVCDLYVPITAPKPFGFEVEFLKGRKDFGKIKMIKTENGCPCMDGDIDDDTLCLLHAHNESKKVIKDAIDGMLCQANTPYLDKKQVVKWFRSIIKNAWRKICHKFEFELTFCNQVAPGALKVRFKSGWVIRFNITPVVQVEDSHVYLISHLPNIHGFSDTNWPVSLAIYEKALLQYFTDILPTNSCHVQCLQIAVFLHKQQNNLTGRCGLTSYHFKSALLHLLLLHKAVRWESDNVADRLMDMLTFLERRLQDGTFSHCLLGNPLVPDDIKLPKDFQTAKSTDILQPLGSDRDPVKHLKELIRNAPVLIQEYCMFQSNKKVNHC